MLPPRALIFLGLNAVRFFSVVGLLLVFASSIFVMVNDVRAVNDFMAAKQAGTTGNMTNCDYIENSTVPNQAAGVFWAILNRLLIIIEVIALLLSECSWPMSFFDTYFPVLGTSFGLGALGIFQCLTGATILSHHVDDFTLVAAFFLFSIGCVNMLCGLIFRERAKTQRSLRGWREEKKSVLPTSVEPRAPYVRSAFAEKYHARGASAGSGFGRQGEKAAGLKGFMISKPMESLPRYAPRPASVSDEEIYVPAAKPREERPARPAYSSHSRSSSGSSASSHSSHYASQPPSRAITPAPQPVPIFHSSPTAI